MSSYVIVRPQAQILTAVQPRPTVSSQAVQNARKKLFGCCESADIDAQLEEENERTSDYLSQRYNFNLKELVEKCNEQNSVDAATTPFYIYSGNEKKTSNFPKLDKEPIFAVAQKNDIKRTFRVRKAQNGYPRVPKRKINQISNDNTKADSHNSEMGANGEKRKCNSWSNNNCNK